MGDFFVLKQNVRIIQPLCENGNVYHENEAEITDGGQGLVVPSAQQCVHDDQGDQFIGGYINSSMDGQKRSQHSFVIGCDLTLCKQEVRAMVSGKGVRWYEW